MHNFYTCNQKKHTHTDLRQLELIVADLQLHAAVALIVLQPVHELDLLQVLVVDLLPLRGQGLIACTVLLQVGHHLVPLLCDALSLLVFLFKLKPGENRGETLTKAFYIHILLL